MRSAHDGANMHGFVPLQDPATPAWPAGFFSNMEQCFFPDNIVFPQGSESSSCSDQTTSPATAATSTTQVPGGSSTTASPDPANSRGATCEEAPAPVGLLVVVFLLLLLVVVEFVLLWREREIFGHPWPWSSGGNPYSANPNMGNPPAGNANVATTA